MLQYSASIKNLFTALGGAQQEFPAVKKDAKNPHFKSRYATLDNAIETLEPILRKFNLVISQPPAGTGSTGAGCTTILVHTTSGEFIAETLLLPTNGPGKEDGNAQSATGGVTYARRTAYLGILGIVADEDDDGNRAVPRPAAAKSTKKTATQTKTDSVENKVSTVEKATIPTESVENQNTKTTSGGDTKRPATEPELIEFKKQFSALTEKLSKAGLTSGKGLPQSKKVLAFMLSLTKAATADQQTVSSWETFLAKANDKFESPETTKAFVDAIETANIKN